MTINILKHFPNFENFQVFWILPLFIVFLDDDDDFVASADDQSIQSEFFSGKLYHLVNTFKLNFEEIQQVTDVLLEQIKEKAWLSLDFFGEFYGIFSHAE